MRADIDNPFIAGNPITGVEMFFGREDVFDWIQQTLPGKHRDNVLVLYGQRRTGKTSLLHQIGRRLAPRYLCIFIDLHGLALQGLDGFLWELAQAITRGLRKDYQIELPRLDRQIFLADARQSFETAFLETVWAAIGNRHLLLMLDEAVRLEEQVRSGKLEPDVFQYLRHLMQHFPRLNFLFSLGSGLEGMEKEYAFLFNTSLYKKISFLDYQAAVELITRPAEDIYRVSPQAVERIWQVTSGHPYYTQLICHSLFNHAVGDGIDLVQPAEVEGVLDEAVERGSAVLKHVWDESTQAEKAILAGMAAALRKPNRPASAAHIRWTLARQGIAIPQVEYPKAIKSLVARDVIVQEGKKLRYKFTVDLQRLWVARHRHVEWVKEEMPSEWIIPESQRARVLSRLRLLLTGWGVLILLIPLILVLGFVAYYLYDTLPAWLPSEGLVWRSRAANFSALSISPDGLTLSAIGGNNIFNWSLPNIEPNETIKNIKIFGDDLSISPDGQMFAVAGANGFIEIIETTSGNQIQLLSQPTLGDLEVLAWSPDRRWLAAGGDARLVGFWETETWLLFGTINVEEDINDLTFSADSSMLLIATEVGDQAWIVQDFRGVSRTPRQDGDVRAIAASPTDPNMMGSINSGGGYLVGNRISQSESDTITGTVKKLHDDTYGVKVAFSPDGSLVALLHGDTLEIHRLQNEFRTSAWLPYSFHVPHARGSGLEAEDLQFSPDGRLIATMHNGQIHLWQVPAEWQNLPTPLPFPTLTHTSTAQPTSTPEPTATSTFAPTQISTIISTPKPTLGVGSTIIWDTDGMTMTMVYIPEGEFLMGPSSTDPNVFPDELPQHTVSLDAYWIDQTEVTNAQYVRCVAAGVCVTPERTSSYSGKDYYGNSTYDDYPVINVSWEDADRYCRWSGRRLPSEAEWEKAARGAIPSDRIYPWGNQLPNCERANFRGCSTDTEPVGAYPDGVSPYGVLNMIGNVWEWVNDWYKSSYYEESPDINPPGPTGDRYKVLRGGGWLSQEAASLRLSNRSYKVKDTREWADIGFRCAVSADY